MRTRKSSLFDPSVAAIIAAGAFIDIAMYLVTGWRLAPDSTRYLAGARQLLAGAPLGERQLGYIGYIGLLAAFDRVGFSLVATYLFQLALSLAAACCASLLCRAWAGPRAGLICGLAWITFVDLQRWNFFLATDGPFVSSVMGCAYLVWRARTGSWAMLLVTALALGAMASLRINGLFFASFFCIYLALGVAGTARKAAMSCVLLAIVTLVPAGRQLIGFVSEPRTEGNVVREGTYKFLVEGHVIWNTTYAPMPPMDSTSSAGPREIVAYILKHPVAVATLYALRLIHYVLADNPRYSFRHRMANLIRWPTFYALAAVGLLSVAKRDAWAAGLAILWACQAALVTLTVGDYDGRYSLYAVPALLPFASVAFDHLVPAGFGMTAESSRSL